jgi:hypothetical protein
MQTAYLITAYKQPRQLARLIRILHGDQCAFFLHIDAKVDDAPFKEFIGKKDNIIFSPRRSKITWGGSALVEATLGLISEALAFDPSFRRFCLLSESDFPIKTNRQILTEFESAREFIRVDRRLGSSPQCLYDNFVRSYWFNDVRWGGLKILSGRIRREPYQGIPGFYHGSSWWALTRECIEYVLQFLSSHDGYRSFFKYTRFGEEIFFHSIVKQSPFASQITHDFETAPNQEEYFLSDEHGTHCINWHVQPDGHPKVLDMEDFDKLLHSQSLFARKFDEQKSAQLIARLENMLGTGC